ncbi:hypothetical protein MUK42_37786 [Musa troglodytarum]|uniref:Uncharacterized protein n=1 Tax=Musa troglodytarum TaxID=320322 RepID=A0A9E7EC14_9LILI|nr:hypothetical protein MUK42_37786 [Musa troglodytarum]
MVVLRKITLNLALQEQSSLEAHRKTKIKPYHMEKLPTNIIWTESIGPPLCTVLEVRLFIPKGEAKKTRKRLGEEGRWTYEEAETGDAGEGGGDGGARQVELAEVTHHHAGDDLHQELRHGHRYHGGGDVAQPPRLLHELSAAVAPSEPARPSLSFPYSTALRRQQRLFHL